MRLSIRSRTGLAYLVSTLLFTVMTPVHAVAEDAWSLLKGGGHVVFIRHAVTEPGIGDPDGFVVADCGSQRNLSSKGRADATAIGEAFRSRAIPVAEVLTSRWCRCVDTAMLAFGKATPSRMLDSMFNDREKPDDEKVRELTAYAAKLGKLPGNMVMVTHAVNINTMTGVYPASGEMVVTTFEGGKFKPVGRIDLFRR